MAKKSNQGNTPSKPAKNVGGRSSGTTSGNTGNGNSGQSPAAMKKGNSGNSSNANLETYELNKAPTVTSTNRKVPQDDSIIGTSLLKATDDGTVTHFRVKDSAGGGWFTLNGTKLKEGTWFNIAVGDLGKLQYVSNNKTTAKNFEIKDTVSILAKDNAGLWSAQKNITVTSVQNANGPLVYTTETSIINPKTVSVQTLFNVRDEDNNTIKRYRFIDQSNAADSGYLVFNGNKVNANTLLEISAADLSKVVFQSGTDFLQDSIRISAFDGSRWGSNTLLINTVSRPRIGTDGMLVLDELERVGLDTLFTQQDSGPSIKFYEVYDGNGGDFNSAHFMKGIFEQATGVVHTIQVADLDQYDLRGGRYEQRSLDNIYVRGFNGSEYSNWEKLVVRTEPQYINGLKGPEGWSDYLSGSPTVITYSFMQIMPFYTPNPPAGFAAFTTAMRTNARMALQQFEDVLNIKFVEVSDTTGGILRFGTADMPDNDLVYGNAPVDADPINQDAGGDILLNNVILDPDGNPIPLIPGFWSGGKGTHAYSLMLRGIATAMGLHYASTGFPILPNATNNEQFTVVNSASGQLYFDYMPFMIGHPNFTTPFGVDLFASSPMLYDVATLQTMYGRNMTTRTGDTTYSYSATEGTIETIYDAGGSDTLDASNQTSFSAQIDLLPGSYSSIGQYDNGKSRNNIGISFDTIIENAVGTNLNDTIRGNDADNILSGLNGTDTIEGRGGDDYLIGGANNDTYVYRLTDGDDIIDDQGGGVDVLELRNVVPTGAGGLDSLTNDLTFKKVGSDLVITLRIDNSLTQGSITLKDYATTVNRIETLKLLDQAGTQYGNNIDLSTIFAAADATARTFQDAGVAGGNGWGNLASVV